MTTTEAFEASLRAEFEMWAKERGHPLCDVIPKYGPASSAPDTVLRFSDIAWEAYQAADKAARATIKQPLTVAEDLMPKPDIRVDAFGEIHPTDRRAFVMGDFYSAEQMRTAIAAAIRNRDGGTQG